MRKTSRIRDRFGPCRLGPVLLALAVLAILAACGTPLRVPERDPGRSDQFRVQEALGTGARTHQPGVGFDGYLISLEKLALKDRAFWMPGKGNHPWLDLTSHGDGEQDEVDRHWLALHLQDPTSHFPTQIFRYRRLSPRAFSRESVFDLYGPDAPPRAAPGSGLQCGVDERLFGGAILERLRDDLVRTLQTGGYTHLVVASTGWNTQLWESLLNYSDWGTGLALGPHRGPFNPLVIGFSWESDWDVGVLGTASFGEKASDADEIGVTWACLLTNVVIPEALATLPPGSRPRYTLLGHSFGARLLTRALNSARFLSPDLRARVRDLPRAQEMICLSGAFSIRRFMEGEASHEGGPYERHCLERCERYFIFSSDRDMAVKSAPLSIWNKIVHQDPGLGLYAGDPDALHTYRKAASSREVHGRRPLPSFAAFKVDQTDATALASLLDPAALRTVNFVDASAVVRRTPALTSGGSHSDVYNPALLQILKSILEPAAPTALAAAVPPPAAPASLAAAPAPPPTPTSTNAP